MTLEELLAGLTAQMKELTDAVVASNAGRADAVAAIAAGAGAEKPKRATGAKAAEPKAPDYSGDAGFELLKKLAGSYMAVDDATERDARKATFKRALDKLNAGKLTDITDAQRPTLATWLTALSAGEDVAELAEEPAAAEEDDLMG